MIARAAGGEKQRQIHEGQRRVGRPLTIVTLVVCLLALGVECDHNSSSHTNQPDYRGARPPSPQSPTSNSTSWLHLKFADHTSRIVRLQQPASGSVGGVGGGYAIEVTPPPPSALFQYQPAVRSKPEAVLRSVRTPASGGGQSELEAELDQVALQVSNTCERDFMLVEVHTSRPFYGLIHTLDYRRKLVCTTEGDGGTHYKLTISHALNPNDPQHCGVARVRLAASAASDEKERELLSVILAIRLSRSIELSEDKFFALNCTNRCRRPDCSSGQLAAGRLVGELQARNSNGWRQLERESGETDQLAGSRGHQPAQLNPRLQGERGESESGPVTGCSVLRAPLWLAALLLCLGLVLVGMLVSNCLICMSLKRNVHAQPTSALKAADDSSEPAAATTATGASSGRRKSRRKHIHYDNFPPDELVVEQLEEPPTHTHSRSRSHHHHHHHHHPHPQNNHTHQQQPQHTTAVRLYK